MWQVIGLSQSPEQAGPYVDVRSFIDRVEMVIGEMVSNLM